MSSKNGKVNHLAGLRQVDTDIHVEMVEMTPAKAMEILANADPNRTVHERRVSAMARDIIGGRFKLNAETIKLAPSGKLQDGEHRLWALVRAAETDPSIKSVPVAVAFNVPPEVRPTIDTGKSRSYADVLRIRGEPRGRFYASALRYIGLYQAGAFTVSENPVRSNMMMTHQELDALHSDKRLLGLLELFEENYLAGMRYAPAVAFVFTRAAEVSMELAQEWAEGVQTGTEMKADDPRFQLRERFHEPTKGKLPQTEVVALAIKSWNLFMLGERVPNLRWRSRGNAAEGFPTFLQDQKPSKRTGLKPDEVKVLRRAKKRAGKAKA